MTRPAHWLMATALWGLAAVACAQAPVAGIYTCIDAKGRKITSDRPIPDCADREQKVLNPSGTVKAKVGPNLTAQERADQEAREREEAERRAAADEEKRRDRAMLARYPNQAAHDKERRDALAQVTAVTHAATKRVDELQLDRRKLDEEMEFYKKDPSKAPQSLRRQIEEVNQSIAVQKRFIADQDVEVRRVNARFDEELARLRQLWALQSGARTATTAAPAPRKP